MKSKRSHEGYILFDHSNSPGLPDDVARKAGLPVGAGRGLFEAPTITCSHCQTVLVINPLRNREREYCRKCDHYICDGCGAAIKAGGECKTMAQVFDEVCEDAIRDQQLTRSGLLFKKE